MVRRERSGRRRLRIRGYLVKRISRRTIDGSHHTARQEASNRQTLTVPLRPHHRPAEFIGLGDNSIVPNVDPFFFNTDLIVTVARFPVWVFNHISVNERAT